MAYQVIYQIYSTNSGGRVKAHLEVKDTDGRSTKWYCGGSFSASDADNHTLSLPFDTGAGDISSSATASWKHVLTPSEDYTGTGAITAEFDRSTNLLTLSSETGLYSTPVIYDLSQARSLSDEVAEWSNGTGGNAGSAQFNMNGALASEANQQSGGSSTEVYTANTPPVVSSAVQSADRQITVAWTASAAQGSQGHTLNPTLTLQYSTDGGVTWTESGKTLSGLSGSTDVSGLNKATVYHWRVKATWATLGASGTTLMSNTDKWAQTITALNSPSRPEATVSTANAVTLTWNRVENNAGYLVAHSADGSNWTTADVSKNTETYTLASGGGKKFKVLAKAPVASYPCAEGAHSWENGAYSAVRETTANTTNEDITYDSVRIDYMAIPCVHVDYNAGGVQILENDLITKGYADEHYSGNAVDVSQLPTISAYNSDEAADDDTHVTTPKYIEDRIEELDLAYDITEIAIASNSSTKFAGVATSVTSAAENYTLITRKGVYDYIAGLNLGSTYAPKTHYHAAEDINSGTLAAARLPNATTTAKGGVIVGAGLSVSSGTVSVDYATCKTGLGLGSAAYLSTGTGSGNIPVLDSNGKLSESILPALAITDTFEADSQNAMLALSSAKKGDICIRSDLNKSYILAADGYSTLANWKELKTPTDAVLSVNGATGAVTQADLGLVTSIGASTNNNNTSFPSSKAVITYVTGLGYLTSGSNLNASKLSSGTVDAARLPWSLATWTDGTTHYSTTGAGLVTQTYLNNAFTDYGFGAAAKKGVATTVGNTGNLITDSAVNLAIGNLDYSDVGAAAEGHKHVLGDITYSETAGYSAGTTISSSSTDGQLATAKAVYGYQPLLTRLKWTSSQAVAGVYTGTATAPSSEDYKIASAYAVKKWIDALDISVTAQYGLTWSSRTLAITRANGTGTYGTVVQSSTANGVTISNGVISLTWANYSTNGDRTSTVKPVNPAYINAYIADQASVEGLPNKIAKFDANGYLDIYAVPFDTQYFDYEEVSSNQWWITLNRTAIVNGLAEVSWVNDSFAQQSAVADYAKWSQSHGNYAVGDVVFYNGGLYRCIQAHVSSQGYPPIGGFPGYWQSVSIGTLTRYADTIIGTGSATAFTVTHNLGEKDVDVTLIEDSTNKEVFAAVRFLSTTQVEIGFGAAPANGKVYRVVVRK